MGKSAQAEFLAEESPFNVIFCRNVLIYFHAEARRRAVHNLHRLLNPDGILYSAPAEARIFSDFGFEILDSECPFAFRRPVRMADAPPFSRGRFTISREEPGASRCKRRIAQAGSRACSFPSGFIWISRPRQS